MKQITLTVILLISALTVVAMGYYARDVYMWYQTLSEAQNLPQTDVPEPGSEVSKVYPEDMQPLFTISNGTDVNDYQVNEIFDLTFFFGKTDITQWTDGQIQGFMFATLPLDKQGCYDKNTLHWCSPSDIPVAEACDKKVGSCEFPADMQKLSIASWYDYHLPEYPYYSQEYDTCASRDYPKGSYLKVTAENGKTVTCRVNDYGPEAWTERQIDLSSHAFLSLAPLSKGLLTVTIEQI